ncbi:MAG: DNA polymerase Y family protein [Rhizobiaceae bacterium]|nr:DNA polymerase Y family protein [Rhizobiaceae bacterium]
MREPLRRYLSLWLPFLSTDRIKRQAASGVEQDKAAPLVLVAKAGGALKLAAADGRALKLGLQPGMSLADARARVPGLIALPAAPEADAALLARIAEACERFTPLVALDAPDGVTLDITGCAHLFGGEAAMLAAVSAFMRRLRVNARAALCSTPDAARALARHLTRQDKRMRLVAPGGDEAALRPLPVTALGLDRDALHGLSRAGLVTLGDLADRPSLIFSSRFGADVARKLDRALGREDMRITPLRPPAPCMAERHFAEPMLQQEAVSATLLSLARDVCSLLERQSAGGRAFEAALFLAEGGVRRIRVETGRPLRDAAALMRLFERRIEQMGEVLDPGFGFDAARMSVLVLEPFETRQDALFSVQAAEEADVAALIDRLTARFGRERVLRFAARDTHDPDREAFARPAISGACSGAGSGSGSGSSASSAPPSFWRMPCPHEPPVRPVHLFNPPQRVEVIAELPDAPPARFRWRRVWRAVALAEGPERIAPEWWLEEPATETRDYYRVEDMQGCRYWIFRRGFYNADAMPGWFLHGLFA